MSLNKDDLTKVVEALDKGRKMQRGAWQRVIDEARKLNQMKTSRSYMDHHGSLVSVCGGDVESYEKMFTFNLMTAIEQACIEDAQLGATVSNHLG